MLKRLIVYALVAITHLPQTSLAAGAVTASQFAVSESGAATLSIPIQVPRGIGGMEPQFSFNYSSTAGNGLLGVGWPIQGPSAISRCAKSTAFDGFRGAVNFDVDDRFCLDGQRLLKIDPLNTNTAFNINSQSGYGGNGTEYRTERDSYSIITAIGPYSAQPQVPRGFKIETKSGLILEFGNIQPDALETSSQVFTNYSTLVGRPKTISRWMLRRISDRLGSFIEFVYCAGEFSNLPTSTPIALTSTASQCASPPANWTGSQPLHY